MSSSRYPKRRRVNSRNKEDTPPEPLPQVYNSSPDELAPSSDREKYHGRRAKSQPKRGSKSRKKSQPDILEELDPDLSVLAVAAAPETSDDVLNATAAAEAEGTEEHTSSASIADPFEQCPDSTLPPSFNEMPRVLSDPLKTPSIEESADQVLDAAPSPLLEDADDDPPDAATASPVEEDDDGVPDAASGPSIEHQQNGLSDAATGRLEDRDDALPNHEPTSPLKRKIVAKLPNDHQMPTFLRRSSTFKKAERRPHDRSTSRSPPPFSTISIPAATPPEPLIGPPQYVPYKQKMVLKGHRRGVAAVRFSPDGRLIASCCECNPTTADGFKLTRFSG
jgi:hypothetical protein